MTRPAAFHDSHSSSNVGKESRDLYAMVLDPDLCVIGATRGEQGFDTAVMQQPDVVVVDVVLPDIDGLVIAVTGVLLKPCPGDRLLAAIHVALKQKPIEAAYRNSFNHEDAPCRGPAPRVGLSSASANLRLNLARMFPIGVWPACRNWRLIQ
jgi:hypothetical protein